MTKNNTYTKRHIVYDTYFGDKVYAIVETIEEIGDEVGIDTSAIFKAARKVFEQLEDNNVLKYRLLTDDLHMTSAYQSIDAITDETFKSLVILRDEVDITLSKRIRYTLHK